MQFKQFDLSNDLVSALIDAPNPLVTISSSGDASTSGVWLMILNSTSAGLVSKPETRGPVSNITTSAAFRQIANLLFGTNTTIKDLNDKTTLNSTVKVIQWARPQLSDGLYYGTITAVFSVGTLAAGSITAVDSVDLNSKGSSLGLTGKLQSITGGQEQWGMVFYDYGVAVFSMKDNGGVSGAAFIAGGSSGFEWGSPAVSKIRLNSLAYKTRSILKRSIYFCRGYNKEFNYTFNPTARTTDGRILGSLSANPASYITTVGLYNQSGELLAVGKISPAKKKSFDNEILFKVQLDF